MLGSCVPTGAEPTTAAIRRGRGGGSACGVGTFGSLRARNGVAGRCPVENVPVPLFVGISVTATLGLVAWTRALGPLVWGRAPRTHLDAGLLATQRLPKLNATAAQPSRPTPFFRT